MPKPRCQSGHTPNSSHPVRPRVCPPLSSVSSPLLLLLVLDSLLSVLGVRKSILGFCRIGLGPLLGYLLALHGEQMCPFCGRTLPRAWLAFAAALLVGGPRDAPSCSQAVHVVSGACTVAPKQTKPTGCSVGPALSARGCFSRKTLGGGAPA